MAKLDAQDQSTIDSPELSASELASIVLAYHDGDHMAAIKALLEDAQHLRYQLALAGLGANLRAVDSWRAM